MRSVDRKHPLLSEGFLIHLHPEMCHNYFSHLYLVINTSSAARIKVGFSTHHAEGEREREREKLLMACLYNCTHKFPVFDGTIYIQVSWNLSEASGNFLPCGGSRQFTDAPSMRNAGSALLIYFNSLCKCVRIQVSVAVYISVITDFG
jgi:hypothetical protein